MTNKVSSVTNAEHEPARIGIREVTIDDVDRILPLLYESWIENAQNAPEVVSEEYFRRTDSAEWLTDFIGSDGKGFVAESGEDVAGVILFTVESAPEYYVSEKLVHIMDVAVAESHRKQGVATALEGRVEEFARQNEIGLITGEVWTYNNASQELMRRMGRTPLYVVYGGIIRDEQ